MPNKSSLPNMLNAVLSTAQTEANQCYPPGIFSDQYNVVTSLLISALVKTYPIGLDMLKGYVKTIPLPVTNGYVVLPEDYRNMLRAAISAKGGTEGSMECKDDDPVIIDTPQEVKLSTLKAGCKSRPLEQLSDEEWDYRTTSSYKAPSYWNPVFCFFEGNKFKVCPFDIGKVELTYVIQEQVYQLGYIMQPDDTYIVDPLTTIDSLWTSAAFDKIYTAMSALYASYTRDPSLTDWARILKTEGIL